MSVGDRVDTPSWLSALATAVSADTRRLHGDLFQVHDGDFGGQSSDEIGHQNTGEDGM
jgi:hypothetical protein